MHWRRVASVSCLSGAVLVSLVVVVVVDEVSEVSSTSQGGVTRVCFQKPPLVKQDLRTPKMASAPLARLRRGRWSPSSSTNFGSTETTRAHLPLSCSAEW